MFMMGTINNIPFTIGIAGAKRIVAMFGMDQYLGIVVLATTFSGIFAGFLNTQCTTAEITHNVRFASTCVIMIIGFVGCALSTSFPVTLVCVFMSGLGSNFGEVVILSLMPKIQRPDLLKSWSTGTGLSGVIASGYIVFCDYFGVAPFWSFIGLAPLVFVHFGAYLFLGRHAGRRAIRVADDTNPVADMGTTTGHGDGIFTSESEAYVDEDNWAFFKYVRWPMGTCFCVYFLEYVVQGAFADCAITQNQYVKLYFFFPMLNLAFQIGKCMARVSFAFVTCPYLGVVTLIQFAAFCVFFFQCFYHYMSFIVQMMVMMVVGIMGGLAYSNSLNMIMMSPRLTFREKELATSWNAIAFGTAILLASLFTLIAENTFLQKYVVRTH